MRRDGLRKYCANSSNWYDWPNLGCFVFIGIVRVIWWGEMRGFVTEIEQGANPLAPANANPFYKVNFQNVASWVKTEHDAIAINALLTFLKARSVLTLAIAIAIAIALRPQLRLLCPSAILWRQPAANAPAETRADSENVGVHGKVIALEVVEHRARNGLAADAAEAHQKLHQFLRLPLL